jgi:hypothetical protein
MNVLPRLAKTEPLVLMQSINSPALAFQDILVFSVKRMLMNVPRILVKTAVAVSTP